MIEIIVVGNEVLLGMVLDTNSHYLSRTARNLGKRVTHISVVPDDLTSIGDELRASLKRNPRLIFLCGGLGPTADDLTLQAVALATDRGLEIDARAQEAVESRYRSLESEGFLSANTDDSRLKMARVPRGATVIENAVGVAPAIAFEIGATLIVALPGVPRELESIVEGPLNRLLIETLGSGGYAELELIAASGDESVLAPLLERVAKAHPGAYIKSRAREFGPDVKFLVTVSATGSSREEAVAAIENAAAAVVGTLAEAGIKVVRRGE